MEPKTLAALSRLNPDDTAVVLAAARWLSHPARKVFLETVGAVLAAPMEGERERLDRALHRCGR